MHRRWMIAGLFVAVAACSHHSGSAADDGAAQQRPRGVSVHVVNNYSLPMDVFVIGVGINHRLGLVTPGVERDFFLPETLADAGAVEFSALPAGGGEGVHTVQIRFNRGDKLDFEIATNLLVSHVSVR